MMGPNGTLLEWNFPAEPANPDIAWLTLDSSVFTTGTYTVAWSKPAAHKFNRKGDELLADRLIADRDFQREKGVMLSKKDKDRILLTLKTQFGHLKNRFLAAQTPGTQRSVERLVAEDAKRIAHASGERRRRVRRCHFARYCMRLTYCLVAMAAPNGHALASARATRVHCRVGEDGIGRCQ